MTQSQLASFLATLKPSVLDSVMRYFREQYSKEADDQLLRYLTKEHTFVVSPNVTWDILLGVDFLVQFNCHLDIRERVLRFGSESTPPGHTNLAFQEDEICAAIAAAVALPPTNLDSILPEHADLNKQDRMDLKSLLATFEDVFAWDERSLGRSKLVRHTIDTGSAKPVWQPPRRIPPHFQTEVNEMIQTMLDAGVIRPSRSPWASPVTLVPKKDGKLRFCIDYRRLNAVTTRDSFPLPRIDVTLDALAGARWFSTLDLKAGYWQVEVEPQDRPKTAFILPQGLFEFETMPFGLCNAAATFLRLMQSV
nr:unnamed protein product [Spirometra erinaceieuropaei]